MKRPAFQFYPGDWLRDTALRSCSIEARGLWMDLLCFMHDGEPYGHLAVKEKPIPAGRVSRLCGVHWRTYARLVRELCEAGVAQYDACQRLYSKRMVRDEEVRQRRAAGGVKSIEHPNTAKPKGTLPPTLKGSVEGGDRRPPPASAVAVASAVSQLHEGAPRRADDTPTQTDAALMGLVRQHLYAPDGKPPAGYTEARDITIICALRTRASGDMIANAIEGLALLRERGQLDWLRPGTKATMRALYNTRTGVRPVFDLAQEAAIKHAARRRPDEATGMRAIGDIIRKAGVS